MKYRIGTRGSKLALTQTIWVKEKLEKAYPMDTFEIVIIQTTGDRIQHIALDKIQDKGLFVKEIEQQILDGTIDFAVHSMKDMPSVLPEGLCFADAWEGEDARDALILHHSEKWEDIKESACIATGSKRRILQLKKLNKTLQCCGIRGNIDTRIRKMQEQDLDGLVLAAAGLHRLELSSLIAHYFSYEEMVPATAQGLLAIECRKDNIELLQKLNALSSPRAMIRMEMERDFQKAMEGSCHVPIGAHCEIQGEEIIFHCVYGPEDAQDVHQLHIKGAINSRYQVLQEAILKMKSYWNQLGKVYLVGGGPGSVDLLTLKGKRLLQEADCIIYDRLLEDEMLTFAKSNCELIYVGKQASNHTMSQEDICRLLVEKAMQYQRVVRLKGGDVYVFGRGGEEGLYLKEHGISFEVVPGVTSAIAGLAYAGIPITHRGIARGFHVVTGQDKDGSLSHIDFTTLASSKDTCVFLMGLSKLEMIVNRLLQANKDKHTPIAIISHATWNTQQTIYGTLETILQQATQQPLPSPAIIVVGEVVALHSALSFVEEKPLSGCKVLLARPSTKGQIVQSLKDEGAMVKEVCTGHIQYHSHRLHHIDFTQYTHLICTSKHGAHALFQALKETNQDIRSLHTLKIYCVGSATASVFQEKWIQVEALPTIYHGDALQSKLSTILEKDDRILYISGAMYHKTLVQSLQEYEYFTHIIAYENQVCPVSDTISLQDYDVALFTCSSAVDACASLWKQTKIPCIVSIGKTTTATLQNYGIMCIEASNATYQDCIEAIKNYWRNHHV